jgi:hypothetical protein
VIPAIGAKITGVSTVSEPRLSPPEPEPSAPDPPPSRPSKTIERDAAGSADPVEVTDDSVATTGC